MTLYELTAQYKVLMELAEDPETDPDVLADTMESIGGEIEDKADSYATIIKTLRGNAEILDAEIKRLTARKAAMLKNADTMEDRMKDSMIATDKRKFKTARFTYWIQLATPSVVMDTDDLRKIPADYLIQQAPKIDKRGISAALKDGAEMPGIAHLERKETLRIR